MNGRVRLHGAGWGQAGLGGIRRNSTEPCESLIVFGQDKGDATSLIVFGQEWPKSDKAGPPPPALPPTPRPVQVMDDLIILSVPPGFGSEDPALSHGA